MAQSRESPGKAPQWKTQRAARQARANATPTERLLWQRLRNRQAGGFKFRRQQEVSGYLADFFCAESKVIVEIDGPIHALRAEQDAARTRWLEDGGLRVLRFSNEEVLNRTVDVIAKIVAAGVERVSFSQNSGARTSK